MKNKNNSKIINKPGVPHNKDFHADIGSEEIDFGGSCNEVRAKELNQQRYTTNPHLQQRVVNKMETPNLVKTGKRNPTTAQATATTHPKQTKLSLKQESLANSVVTEQDGTELRISHNNENYEHADLSEEKLLPIHIPVIMNDVNKVRHYFERDPKTGQSRCNPNIRCLRDGSSALLVAIRSKKYEVAKILLTNGADVTLTDNSGDNALLAAVKTGDANVINLLWPYRKDLNVNHTNKHGFTALHMAADRRWEGCLNFLLQNKADPNCQALTGETPLMLAAANGDTKTVDNLIKSNADILMEDSSRSTCICKAFEKDQKEMALYLLQKLPEHKKDLFIRSRLELIMHPMNPEEEKRLLENSYYPILHHCTALTGFRNVFYNLKIIQKITEKLEEHNQNFELTLLASHLIFCIMYRFTLDVDVKFVRQFIKCKGPDIIIYITKYYTEQWKIPEREIISIFLPMIGLSELTEGRTWLKKNYVHVSEYVNHFDKSCLSHCLAVNSDCHWCPDCDYHRAISLAWDRFHFVMDGIQTEEREKHMSELLEDEAREKERQIKKKEKKKHKKQEKSRKNEEVASDNFNNDIEHLCETSEQFGNANTNAGQDISKLCRRQRSMSESSNSSFCSSPTTPLTTNAQYFQMTRPYQEQMYIDSSPKGEQWTTIQTKRQIQKEKKTPKKYKEKMISDASEMTRKTPRKSPKKKNVKHPQIIHGHAFISGPVSGTTRWADIAKSTPRKADTGPKSVPVTKPAFKPAPAVENISFATVDFPSLCIPTEEKTPPEKNISSASPDKNDHSKPSKFTFLFHEPIPEPCPVKEESLHAGSNNLNTKLEDTQLQKCVTVSKNKSTLSTQESSEHHVIDFCKDGDRRTENEYSTEPEVNHVEYCSEDECSQDNTPHHTPAHAVIQDEDIYESESYPEDDDNSQEDWSKEIEEIEAACAMRNAYSDEPVYQSDEANEDEPLYQSDDTRLDESCLQVHASEEPVTEHAEPIPVQQQEEIEKQVISEDPMKTEYVGPENCQVDLFTLIQHQTEAFAYFERLVEVRENVPFFDPAEPIPNLDTDTYQPKSVDIMFENLEEIPSWYTDNEIPSHEDTWNEMEINSQAYANIDVSATQQDFTVDPAIIGYRNVSEHSQVPNKSPELRCKENEISSNIVKPSNDHQGYINNASDDMVVNKTEVDGNNDGFNHELKQTAVIKPLPNKQKHELPVLNAPFGQSILQNACDLEHLCIEDDVGYPEELNGVPYPDNGQTSHTVPPHEDNEESNDNLYFPGFHTNTKLSANIDCKDFSVFHRMQQIQYEQLAQYYDQNKQQILGNPLGSHQDNFVYYAQCAGMNGNMLDKCLAGNAEFQPQTENKANVPRKTFKDLYVQEYVKDHRNDSRSPNTPTDNLGGRGGHQQTTHLPANTPPPSQPMSPVYPYGQYTSPAQMHPSNIHLIQATQAAMAATVMNQIKEMYKSMMKAKMKSIRWRDELWQLRNLPPEKQMVVGKIVIPMEEQDRICISNVSSGSVVLGFLSDGTEVAVKVIKWAERDFALDELQHLVNLDVSKYFMNKYMAFCSHDGFYYIAMTLYEYSLPEYLSKLGQDGDVDVTIARNKLVWQFMRGLASLHQHCLLVHGELKPENVVIDLDGNIKIAGYGICKNINRDTPFIEYCEEDKCWLAPEVLVHKQKVSFKSDIFVAGMIMYYILSGGRNIFGSEPSDIIRNITQHSYIMDYIMEEAVHLLSLMLSVNKSERPCISEALRHPYFWADEKRLRFILIAGSDVLRDLKSGIPMDGSVRDSMIHIIGSSPCNINIINWIPDIEPVIMNEMRVFRQYKNNVVELVLFVYNCCLHFDKMSDAAREIIDEPCKYFLTKFSNLFMTVYRAIKLSNRTDRTCYKPFF